MTDADTPRVPDRPQFRWHDDHGMFREHGGYWHHVLNRQGWGPAATLPEELATMPADAVKLGDVEALRAQYRQETERCEHTYSDLERELSQEHLRAERFKRRARRAEDELLALRALRADIRAVLDDWRAGGFNSPVHQRIRALVDREGNTTCSDRPRTKLEAGSLGEPGREDDMERRNENTDGESALRSGDDG